MELGYRQAVRHWFLVPVYMGSNPIIPNPIQQMLTLSLIIILVKMIMIFNWSILFLITVPFINISILITYSLLSRLEHAQNTDASINFTKFFGKKMHLSRIPGYKEAFCYLSSYLSLYPLSYFLLKIMLPVTMIKDIHDYRKWSFIYGDIEGITGDASTELHFDAIKRVLELKIIFVLDGFSFLSIFLTVFIFPSCSLLLNEFVYFRVFEHCILLFVIQGLLSIAFPTTNLFIPYLSFEALLIPMFLLIGLWGTKRRKIHANYYFFMYTLFGSLFLLIGLCMVYVHTGSFEYTIILEKVRDPSFMHDSHLIQILDSPWINEILPTQAKKEIILWFLFFVPFAIKIPPFPFHLWLPEAHVEAPTLGSVILASLLLKLGGYGLLKYVIFLFPTASFTFAPYVYSLTFFGVWHSTMMVPVPNDLKKIVAYSSIAHMNFAVAALFSFTYYGILGSLFLMFIHGLVSAGLFLCVGVLYKRYETRNIHYYGGLVEYTPMFSVHFFLFSLANIAFPGTGNSVGEFLCIPGLAEISNYNITFILLAISRTIIATGYSIFTFARINYGTPKFQFITNFYEIDFMEHFVCSYLILMILYAGLVPSFFTNYIEFMLLDSLQGLPMDILLRLNESSYHMGDT